jgi:hypothetical protein
MTLDLQVNDAKRLERLKRSLNASEMDVISKALEVLERREALRMEILKPAKGFKGMTEREANELAVTEVRVVRQRH